MSRNKTNRKTKKTSYQKDLAKHHIYKRKRNRETAINDQESVTAMQQKYGIVPRVKARASIKELITMIGIVLDTGNGTTVIKIYAKEYNKNDQWRDDIAKPTAGEPFALALKSFSNHPVMIAIENSVTFCKKTILKQTVTGAFRFLSKHVKAYREIVAKELEVQQLKDKLAIKDSLAGKSPDWELAQQMRNQGETIRSIADTLGVSKSAAAKHTKPRPK